MNELILKGKTIVCGIEIPKIAGGFGPDKPAMLAKTIAELHEMDLREVNQAINRNRDKFRDGIDIIDLKNSINLCDPLILAGILSKQSAVNSVNIYILSRIGYGKLLKIFNDDLAWDKYEQILDEYFEMKEQEQPRFPQPQCVEDLIAQQAQLMQMQAQSFKELKTQVASIADKQIKHEERLEAIKETIVARGDEWRKWINEMLNKIAKARGNLYFETKAESYRLLTERAHCDLDDRLKHLKQNLKKAGANKTRLNKVNYLDVIEADPRLREIYTMIVKEMAIRYVA